jgi:hypothetical protein
VMVKIHIIYYSTCGALSTVALAPRSLRIALCAFDIFLSATGTSSRWQKKWHPPSQCACLFMPPSPPEHPSASSMLMPLYYSSDSHRIRPRATKLPFTRYCDRPPPHPKLSFSQPPLTLRHASAGSRNFGCLRPGKDARASQGDCLVQRFTPPPPTVAFQHPCRRHTLWLITGFTIIILLRSRNPATDSPSPR